MKKFILNTFGENARPQIYTGDADYNSSSYSFYDNGELEIKITKNGVGYDLYRRSKELEISGTLIENSVCELQVILLENNTKGIFPVRVNRLEVDYPRSIIISYDLLDSKNCSCEEVYIYIKESM